MRKLNLFLLIFALFIPYAFASDFYNVTGYESGTFEAGASEFDTQVQEIYYSKVLGDGRKHAIVSDLDNDGLNEIVALDGTIIKVYHKILNTFSLNDSFTLDANEQMSNIIATDIDADGLTELVFYMETQQDFIILEYNGTDFYNQTTIHTTSPDVQTMLQCLRPNECILADVNKYATFSSGYTVRASLFNSTQRISGVTLETEGTSNTGFCYPLIKNIALNDYDNDGEKEYIISGLEIHAGSSERIKVFVLDVAGTSILNEYEIDDNIGQSISVNPDCNTLVHSRFISAPLVADMEVGGDNEILVGYMESEDTFQMNLYDTIRCASDSACFIDDYPDLFTADGELVSNPILANIFGDTGKIDFCILGQDPDLERLDLLCGSKETDIPLTTSQTREFIYSVAGRYNITQEYDRNSIMMHELQIVDEQVDIAGTGNTDTSEILTSYGTFKVSDEQSNESLWVKSLDQLWRNDKGESAIIPIDYDQVGLNDMIMILNSNIYYVDDGLEDLPSTVTDLLINPCPTGVRIKVNTTMVVDVTVTDNNPEGFEQDLVSANVSVYYGDDNVQWESFIDQPSGVSLQTQPFQINKSIVNGVIRIEAWDQSHPDTVDVQTQTFTVGLTGVEFGDLSCQFEFEVDEDIIDGVPTVVVDCVDDSDCSADQLCIESVCIDKEDTGSYTALNEVSGYVGISLTVLWIIFMFVAIYYIWTQGSQKNPAMTLGIIGIAVILLLILGWKFGAISTGIITIITVMVIAVIGLWLGRILTSSRTNG